MANVFISHSSKDKEFALELKRWIDGNGHKAWLDSYDLLVGDSFRTTIKEGIESCEVVVFVLSPDALKSKWFNYELRLAQTPDGSGQTKQLLPVLLKDCENLPPDLEGVKCADFREGREQGWMELELALSRRAKNKQSPPPPPPSPSPSPSPSPRVKTTSSPAKAPSQSSISAFRVMLAVIFLIGGLGLTLAAGDKSAAPPTQRTPGASTPRRKSLLLQFVEAIRGEDNPAPPAAAQPLPSQSIQAVGGKTRSLVELRSQHWVRPLQDSEATSQVAALPGGVFGFTEAEAFTFLRQARLRPSQASNAFEVHKTSAGELLVVGYTLESDFKRASAGQPVTITMAPRPNQVRGRLISIPMNRVKAVKQGSDDLGQSLTEFVLGSAVPLP